MNDIKTLAEQREAALAEMTQLTDAVKAEERTFTEEENTKFADLEKRINDIDATVNAIEKTRTLEPAKEEEKKDMEETRTQELTTEELEIRTFANVLRNRDDANITKTANGAVIPKTIANKIIDAVKDISPLYRMSEKFNVRGQLSIPYVDTANDHIAVAYATEFTDLVAVDTKLLSVDLTGFLAGVLCKISKSLINATDFDLVNFVINKIAAAVAVWIDSQIINGTVNKITGLSGATNTITAAATNAITVNELITLQDGLKSAYQDGAIWVMAPATWTAIKKVLAGTSNYELNASIEGGFAGRLLGKPVYTSDQVEAMAASKRAVFYVNPAEALATKLVEDSVQILNEKYAVQHAVGVVAWYEADCKVQNQQAAAVLVMKAS